jgi:hypothetical protein
MGFLSNLLGFENSFTKNFTGDILSNPTRLLTGIDPASTKLWNTVLNRDDPALVNWFGSPGQQYYDQAQQEGIDTGAAEKFHSVADTIAGIYGANGLTGSLGFGSLGSASGPSSISGALGDYNNMAKIGNAAAGDSKKEGNMNLGGLLGAGFGALAGMADAKSSARAAAQGDTSQNKLDPRIEAILFGGAGNNGLLGQFQSLLNQPEGTTSAGLGTLARQYLLNGSAGSDLEAIRQNSLNLLRGNQAPVATAVTASNPMWVTTPKAQAAQITAPGQNNIDLTGAFNSFLAGGTGAAENPYLTKSLQAGADLANANFRTNLGDLTDTLQRRILPGLRDSAIGAGQYGGSRQGIAEGNALSDFTRQATDAAGKLGLANSANMIGAQAGQFDAGQNRALSALTNLSGQQYGVAGQNAAFRQQANLGNADTDLRAQLANQNAGNNFTLSNRDALNQFGLANQGAQLQTNAQNNAAGIAGAGSLQGMLSLLSSYGNASDNFGINRAGQVNELLRPYMTANQTTISTQPNYTNNASSAVGGALAGLNLYNQFFGKGS